MSTLTFPKHCQQTGHDMVSRAAFVGHYARLAGIDVKYVENNNDVWVTRKAPGKGWHPHKGNLLSCIYNDRQILFEFSDFPGLGKDWTNLYPNVPIFRFHYSNDLHDEKNIFPIGPCMILPAKYSQFERYFALREKYHYSCSTDLVSNRQEPRRLAEERRNKVQQCLRREYRENVDINWKGTQWDYWITNENALASICVPGACNNMLDRGHYELLGLGVCTISPHIPTILPWNKMLEPSVHYIQCKDDYSDLVEKIEWSRRNRQMCVDIGQQAKELFDNYCSPKKYWEWIDVCLEKYDNE